MVPQEHRQATTWQEQAPIARIGPKKADHPARQLYLVTLRDNISSYTELD